MFDTTKLKSFVVWMFDLEHVENSVIDEFLPEWPIFVGLTEAPESVHGEIDSLIGTLFDLSQKYPKNIEGLTATEVDVETLEDSMERLSVIAGLK